MFAIQYKYWMLLFNVLEFVLPKNDQMALDQLNVAFEWQLDGLNNGTLRLRIWFVLLRDWIQPNSSKKRAKKTLKLKLFYFVSKRLNKTNRIKLGCASHQKSQTDRWMVDWFKEKTKEKERMKKERKKLIYDQQNSSSLLL